MYMSFCKSLSSGTSFLQECQFPRDAVSPHGLVDGGHNANAKVLKVTLCSLSSRCCPLSVTNQLGDVGDVIDVGHFMAGDSRRRPLPSQCQSTRNNSKRLRTTTWEDELHVLDNRLEKMRPTVALGKCEECSAHRPFLIAYVDALPSVSVTRLELIS